MWRNVDKCKVISVGRKTERQRITDWQILCQSELGRFIPQQLKVNMELLQVVKNTNVMLKQGTADAGLQK